MIHAVHLVGFIKRIRVVSISPCTKFGFRFACTSCGARKMRRQIVIAVEKAESGIHAAEWAFEKLVKEEDNVTLISAVQLQAHLTPLTGTAPAYDEISRTIQHDMVADVEKMLTYIASKLQQREGQVQTRVLLGDPRDAIVDFVHEAATDILVIGSSNKGLLKRMTLGSVSDYVIRHAPCPVMLVKAGA